MKPFLLVSTRPEEEALASEYRAYRRGAGLEESQLELAEFDLVGLPEIEPGRYSGVFVAGSPYGGTADGYVSSTQRWVREELAALFEQLLAAGTPILATGSSVGILGAQLGFPVSSRDAEFGEIVDIELTRDAWEDPVFEGLPDAFVAYVNHGDAVEELPESETRLARSLNTVVQAFRHGENVYGIQFNPELDSELMFAKTEAFADAGDSGIGDIESLVTTGRQGSGEHSAAKILANFVKVFSD